VKACASLSGDQASYGDLGAPKSRSEAAKGE